MISLICNSKNNGSFERLGKYGGEVRRKADQNIASFSSVEVRSSGNCHTVEELWATTMYLCISKIKKKGL